MTLYDPFHLLESKTLPLGSRIERRQTFEAGILRSIAFLNGQLVGVDRLTETQIGLVGHALKAFEQAILQGQQPESLIALLEAMRLPMLFLGRWQEWESVLRTIIRSAEQSSPPKHLFEPYHFLAELCLRTGRPGESLSLSRQNLQEAAAIDHLAWQAASHQHLADALLQQEIYAEAEPHIQESLRLAKVLDDSHLYVDGLIFLAHIQLQHNKVTAARMSLLEALSTARGIHDERAAAKSLELLAHIACKRKEWASALGHFQKALTLFTAYGDQMGRGEILVNMGWVNLRMGRIREAEAHLKIGQQIYRQTDYRQGIETTRELMAEIYENKNRQGNSMVL